MQKIKEPHGFTGISIKIQGHLKINEYKTRQDYSEGQVSKQLLNKRNAVHKDDAAIMIGKILTDRSNGIAYMIFGNGGTTLDDSGNVTLKPPNVDGLNADLYNPVFFQLVDDMIGALPGNQMAIRHIANTMFTDVEIRCLINVNQPFGQLPSNTLYTENNEPYFTSATSFGPFHSQFNFDEIGLKLADGTLVTHVIFTPILKTASALLEVVYTLRIAIAQPQPVTLVSLTGVQANALLTAPAIIRSINLLGVQANTQLTIPTDTINEYNPAGGKFYFEITLGPVGNGRAAQIGFINPYQRDTNTSSLTCIRGVNNGATTVVGGLTISMGADANSAVVIGNDGGTIGTNGMICGHHFDMSAPEWNNGDTIGIAIDTINNLFWLRNWTQTVGTGMTGAWNGAIGAPTLGTGGFDISPIVGDLLIWYGAYGHYEDSATLNTGSTLFHGLDGTHVIPSGFTAWDPTGSTIWDATTAARTNITGEAAGSAATLQAVLSNANLTATIQTVDSYPGGSANLYASTWQDSVTYFANSTVMDGINPGTRSGFYNRATTFLEQGFGFNPASFAGPIQGWFGVMIGVVSNTIKHRV